MRSAARMTSCRRASSFERRVAITLDTCAAVLVDYGIRVSVLGKGSFSLLGACLLLVEEHVCELEYS